MDIYRNNYVLNEFNAMTYKLTTWETEGVEINNNEAKITILENSPNIGEIFGKNIAEMLAKSYEDKKIQNNIYDDIYKKAINELKKGNFTYINVKNEVRFKRENNRWKIFIDLEKNRRVFKLLRGAIKLLREEKCNEARDKLEEILSMDRDNAVAHYIMKRFEKCKK